MLKINQPKVEFEQSRMPINISFVLDRSGSMSGDKLSFTKKAVYSITGITEFIGWLLQWRKGFHKRVR